MAVLTNTMLQGSSAVTDDSAGPYVIEKSLRFAEEDTTRISYEASNVKACFFLSFWIKRCEIGDRDDVFVCNDNTGFFFYFDSDGRIKINDNYSNHFNSVNYYNDVTGWYHVFFEHDKDNLSKLYVNGKLDSTSSSSGPALANDSWHVGWDGNNGYCSGLLADVCVLELPDTHVCAGPVDAGVGEFNDLGDWVPKDLKDLDFTVGENSFWFKWDDSTTMRADHLWINYGKSREPSAANGGKPILKTTDAFGHWAQHPVAYNTDSNASALVLAIPGNGLVDKSHTIKGSGSAVTVTANGSIENSSVTSRFYDRSIRFDGSDDNLTISSPPFTISDRGTTYTIEGWIWADSSVFDDNTYRSIFNAGDFNMGFWRSCHASGSKIYVEGDGSGSTWGATLFSSNPITKETWYHVAFVRNGSSLKLFLNGVLQQEVTSSGTDTAEGSWIMGAAVSTRWKGYMQDFRVYNTAIYSSNFNPPTRVNWTGKNGFVSGNVGKGWSYSVTSETGWITQSGTWKGPHRIFDGDTGTSAQTGSTAASMYVEFPKPITVSSKLRVQYYGDTSNAPSAYFKVYRGSSISRTESGSGVWQDLGFTGELRSIEQYVTAGVSNQLYSIEVDDEILTDYQSVIADSRNIDIFVDTPTNSVPGGDDDTRTNTAFTKRGNYATLQPGRSNWTVTQANLKAVSSGSYGHIHSNFGLPHYGKWYAEATANSTFSGTGVMLARDTHLNTYMCNNSDTARNVGYGYLQGGQIITTNRSTTNSWGATWGDGDVIGLAFDADNGTLAFYKNGVNQGTAYSSIPVEPGKFWFFGQNDDSNTGNSDMTWNFGQKPWAYPCPAGYRACCTENLNDTFSGDNTNKPNNFFDTKLYTGTGSELAVTGFNFQPELVWIKPTSAANDHVLVDAARGVTKRLFSNTTAAESTQAESLKTFNSDGFTLGDHSSVNTNNVTHVAWAWDAGNTGQANTDGAINVSAGNQWVNQTSGFSITAFTGNGSNTTIGHGLNAKPGLVIVKNRDSATSWVTWHMGYTEYKRTDLNDSGAYYDSSQAWNNTAHTNTLVNLGTAGINTDGEESVMYCWAPIFGYSHMGIYKGTANTNGEFNYCGFRPAWITIRHIGSGGGDWQQYDLSRNSTGNPFDTFLELNDTDAEKDDGYSDLRVTSNGFKVIKDGNDINLNNDLIYIAFAERPYKTARAV